MIKVATEKNQAIKSILKIKVQTKSAGKGIAVFITLTLYSPGHNIPAWLERPLPYWGILII